MVSKHLQGLVLAAGAVALGTSLVGCIVNATVPVVAGSPGAAAGAGTGAGPNGTTAPGGSAAPNASAAPGASAAPAGSATEAEPNDDFAQATRVALGAQLTASLSKDDVDFYTFAAPEGVDGVLSATTRETNAWRPQLHFFGSDRATYSWETPNDDTQTPFTASRDLTGGKTYFFKYLAGGVGSYELKFDWAPVADAFEPNDSFEAARPLELGKPVDLYCFAGRETNKGSDDNYFTVDLPADKTRLRVAVANKSTKAAPQQHFVYFYTADKASQSFELAASDQADLNVTKVLKPGKIFLNLTAKNATVPSQLTVTAE